MSRKRFLISLTILSILSFAVPVLVFAVDVAGIFPTQLEQSAWPLLCISFAAMVVLTLWGVIEAIKEEQENRTPGFWLGVFLFTGPIGAFIFLINRMRSANVKDNQK